MIQFSHGFSAARHFGKAPIGVLSRGLASKPRILVISGPTGVGKTDISLKIAEQLNGEIISADSAQVLGRLPSEISRFSDSNADFHWS